MLLFIAVTLGMTTRCLNFNTSHVTVYHSRASFCNSFNIHFNTSHVTVYQQRNCTGSTRDIISIHLMLLFITVWMYHPCSRCSISIHLMLLFICNQNCDSRCGWLFQYISCYCLSVLSNHLGQRLRHFNTSHVTVYLFPEIVFFWTFSNFNTSHVTVYQKGVPDCYGVYEFQYISCYCLSVSNIFKT